MKKLYAVITLATIAALFTGCTIPHFVAADYPRYLSNNYGASKLPTTKAAFQYSMTPNTEHHKYEFRSATVGYANLWVVEIGKMLEKTLQSKDIQEAFGKLEKSSARNKTGADLIVFDLASYAFVDYGAHITLRISLTSGGKEILAKTYDAEGKTQGKKMFWGGVFGMKNAIQQSTKLALDEILRSFIHDINKK